MSGFSCKSDWVTVNRLVPLSGCTKLLSRYISILGARVCPNPFIEQSSPNNIKLINFIIKVLSWQCCLELLVTARRYNLVGVSRRKHRVESWYFSQKTVTVQGGYGALFAVRVQILWTIRVSRYKADRGQITSQGIQSFCGHWRGRGISYY